MKKALLATAALCLLSTPSYAGKFSGPFLGLNVGYSFGDSDLTYDDGTTGFGDFSKGSDYDGFEGGVFAGFRHQFMSPFNLGLEAGYVMSGSEGSHEGTINGNVYDMDFDKKNEWYVSLKPGWTVSENTLAYGIVGYQRSDFDGDLVFNGVDQGSDDDSFDGFHIGAGIEHMIGDSVSLRGEYKYLNYNDNDYSAINGQKLSFDNDESVVRLGLAFNLNGGAAKPKPKAEPVVYEYDKKDIAPKVVIAPEPEPEPEVVVVPEPEPEPPISRADKLFRDAPIK